MDRKEFESDVKGASRKRIYKVTGSHGVKEAFTYYRANRPRESEYVLTDCQYFSIIRKVNDILRKYLAEGNEIELPERMGKLEIRKRPAIIEYRENKVYTNLPIDWDSTLKLWYEDEESYRNRKLVRQEIKEIYKIFYNKHRADYTNKTFYRFQANRELKKMLSRKIKSSELDAPLLYAIKYGKDNNSQTSDR